MCADRVLVVEDDDIARRALVQQLRQLGRTKIDEISDGESARQALEGRVEYQLILCDLMLPGLDAVELLRSVSRRRASSGLVLMSSHGEEVLRSIAVLCRERGLRVLGVMRKPIRAETLAKLLAELGPQDKGTARPPSRMLKVEDLQHAMALRMIDARFQPIVNALDGALVGTEVLAHWDDPALGEIAPARLARLADENGLGAQLMQYMVGLALRSCAEWRLAGLHTGVSINAGNGVLQDLGFPGSVDRMLKGLQLQPESLTIEVGENVPLDSPQTRDVLSRLRLHGVNVALDNFGRGPVSAARVMRLPISELKVDRSFVRNLPDSEVSGSMVSLAASLARGLGIRATAVGVENAEQARAVTERGCDRVQGYWIGRPMLAEEMIDWSRTRPSTSSDIAPSRDADHCVTAVSGAAFAGSAVEVQA